jgi:hypothetical protein
MPTVWDQFSDPVESPQSWDDISAPATPELSPADQQIMQDRHWKGLTKEKLDQRLALERADPSQYDPSSTEYQERYDQPGVMRTVGSAALRAPVTLADTTVSVGRNVAAAPVAGLAGLITAPLGFVPGMEGVGARNVERVQSAIGGQPFTEGGQQMTDAVGYVPGKIEQATDWAGQKAANATGSPLVGATVKTAINAIPMLAGGGAARARVRGNGDVGPVPPRRAVEAGKAEASASVPAQAGRGSGLDGVPPKTPSVAAPTLEQLQKAKSEAYKRAEQSGVVVSRDALNRLKVDLSNTFARSKPINEKLYPKTAAAFADILDTKGQLTLSQIDELRKVANAAKMSSDRADAFLGGRLVDKIDEFESALTANDLVAGEAGSVALLNEARALNSRYRKAEAIDDIFKSARRAVGANYTVAGMETALRQKFRALADNKKKMRGFNAEERAAIEHFIEGGKTQNFLRRVGKFAPDGVMSGYGAVAASVLNPALAIIPVAGGVSKFASTRLGVRNANRVSELVRRGPQNALMQKQPVMAE